MLALIISPQAAGADKQISGVEEQTENVNKRQDLRLYRINKDGIGTRFWFTRGKAKKPGCHNIRKKSRLHRAVQFGYPVCRIYTRKNCLAESVVSFIRDDEPQATTELTQGYSWFSVSKHARGERIKSWYCGDIMASNTSHSHADQ